MLCRWLAGEFRDGYLSTLNCGNTSFISDFGPVPWAIWNSISIFAVDGQCSRSSARCRSVRSGSEDAGQCLAQAGIQLATLTRGTCAPKLVLWRGRPQLALPANHVSDNGVLHGKP